MAAADDSPSASPFPPSKESGYGSWAGDSRWTDSSRVNVNVRRQEGTGRAGPAAICVGRGDWVRMGGEVSSGVESAADGEQRGGWSGRAAGIVLTVGRGGGGGGGRGGGGGGGEFRVCAK